MHWKRRGGLSLALDPGALKAALHWGQPWVGAGWLGAAASKMEDWLGAWSWARPHTRVCFTQDTTGIVIESKNVPFIRRLVILAAAPLPTALLLSLWIHRWRFHDVRRRRRAPSSKDLIDPGSEPSNDVLRLVGWHGRV